MSFVAGEQIGRVVGGRFRLEALVGRGAAAEVYLAVDTRLRRRVAVKVLHPGMAGDPQFVRRFRSEAQLASRLTHPNILVIHDWNDGTSDASGRPNPNPAAHPAAGAEPAYLITEFLDGGSLRSMLDEHRRLSLSQVALIGIEASRALAYAHGQGIVHRDIKPANLLFAADGSLRIGDFGLARAIAEAALTEPDGSLVGTARYAAPEQAAGGVVDGRADVYALAVTLIEAATGEAPFRADTPIGVLMARQSQPLVAPESMGVLAEALLPAGTVNPSERIDAAELLRRLERCTRSLPRPAPLPLVMTKGLRSIVDDPTIHAGAPVAPLAEAPVAVVPEPAAVPGPAVVPEPATVSDPAAALSPTSGAEAALSAPSAPAAPAAQTDPGTNDQVAPMAATTVPTVGGVLSDPLSSRLDRDSHPHSLEVESTDEAVDHREAPGASQRTAEARHVDEQTVSTHSEPRSRSRRTVLVGGLGLLVAGGGGAFGVKRYLDGRPVYRVVPGAVGLSAVEARQAVEAVELVWASTSVFNETVPAGQVISQDPQPNASILRGSTVSVVLSDGPKPRPVPTVVGMTEADAITALNAVQLRGTLRNRPFDETAPEGQVLVAEPASGEVPRDSEVLLDVSAGPAPREVPNLSGMTPDQAMAALPDGLAGVVVSQPSETVPAGVVIAANYKPTTKLPRGSTVKIIVSTGPPLITVPATKGLGVLEASQALRDAGLVVDGVEGSPDQPVLGTRPAVNQQVKRGTAVIVITGPQ